MNPKERELTSCSLLCCAKGGNVVSDPERSSLDTAAVGLPCLWRELVGAMNLSRDFEALVLQRSARVLEASKARGRCLRAWWWSTKILYGGRVAALSIAVKMELMGSSSMRHQSRRCLARYQQRWLATTSVRPQRGVAMVLAGDGFQLIVDEAWEERKSSGHEGELWRPPDLCQDPCGVKIRAESSWFIDGVLVCLCI